MKTVKILILGIVVVCFIVACNVKSETKPLQHIVINNVKTCYVPYELNPLDINDTINRMFYDGTKLGHWIVFQMVIPNGALPLGAARPPVRAKMEEGNYINNKKEGYWKKYRTDGTFRDSVPYVNDVPGC